MKIQLQERLDEMYAEEIDRANNREDIGFPAKKIGKLSVSL